MYRFSPEASSQLRAWMRPLTSTKSPLRNPPRRSARSSHATARMKVFVLAVTAQQMDALVTVFPVGVDLTIGSLAITPAMVTRFLCLLVLACAKLFMFG